MNMGTNIMRIEGPPDRLHWLADLTEAAFHQWIGRSHGPVVLAFCADECAASQRLLALLTEAATNSAGLATFAVANPATAPALVARLEVAAAPAVFLFLGGTMHYQFIGEISRRELAGLLARAGRMQLQSCPP